MLPSVISLSSPSQLELPAQSALHSLAATMNRANGWKILSFHSFRDSNSWCVSLSLALIFIRSLCPLWNSVWCLLNVRCCEILVSSLPCLFKISQRGCLKQSQCGVTSERPSHWLTWSKLFSFFSCKRAPGDSDHERRVAHDSRAGLTNSWVEVSWLLVSRHEQTEELGSF